MNEQKKYIKERNEALLEFIMNDNLNPIYKYCKKYNIEMPKNERALKGGIYKAVQYVDDIPQAIKDFAFEKCIELGLYPFINDEVDNEKDN